MQDRELSVARLTPRISNERRIVACLYSVVFTAELLVNTRRKSLVKQPVVVRDSDHRIPPSSGGRNLVDDTRARESRFVRGRRKEGRKVRCGRRRSPARQGCVLSWRPHRYRDLDVVQSCDSPPVYTIYNRTRFHGKEISADSLSRERKLMQRFIFDTRIVREQYTSICQFVGSILKKDSKGNIWLVNIWSRRDNVIDSRLKHRRQNTFVT